MVIVSEEEKYFVIVKDSSGIIIKKYDSKEEIDRDLNMKNHRFNMKNQNYYMNYLPIIDATNDPFAMILKGKIVHPKTVEQEVVWEVSE